MNSRRVDYGCSEVARRFARSDAHGARSIPRHGRGRSRRGGRWRLSPVGHPAMQRSRAIVAIAVFATTLVSCARLPTQEAPTTPRGLALAGQKDLCAAGPQHRTFRIAAKHASVSLGRGFKTQTWTYGGTLPGPVIEACEGDTVTIRMTNQDTDPVMGADHGFDS